MTYKETHEDAVEALHTIFRRLLQVEEERKTADNRLEAVCERLNTVEGDLASTDKLLDDIVAALRKRRCGDA
jgi:hypothetical protein